MYIYEVYLYVNGDVHNKRFFSSYDKCEFYARAHMLKNFQIDPDKIKFSSVLDDWEWKAELDSFWITEPWDYKFIKIKKYILGE